MTRSITLTAEDHTIKISWPLDALEPTMHVDGEVLDLNAETPGLGQFTGTIAGALAMKLIEANTEIVEMQATLDDITRLYREAASQHGYWYRRCEFAETALAEFPPLDPKSESFEERFATAVMHATVVLAERRKGDLPNYEDVIRAQRQKKMLAWQWAAFSGVDDERLASSHERARRMLEEAAELYHAVTVPDVNPPFSTLAEHRGIAIAIVNRVFRNPPGEIPREAGQLALTLNILAENLGFQLADEEKKEFERVLSIPPSVWRARWQKKIDEGL